MRRRTSLVTAVAATALLAAGCGITDDAAQPGVAAEVDGQSIALSKVDSALEDYCSYAASQEGAPTYAKAAIRAQIAWNWAQAVAVGELAPAYSVDLPAGVERDFVERAWGEDVVTDDNYDSLEFLTWVQLRLEQPLAEIGSQLLIDTTGKAESAEAAQAAGLKAVDEWLDKEGVELNPVFGTHRPETSDFLGDSLSVAVSGQARTDEQIAVRPTSMEEQQASDARIAALPAEQRCGPAVQGQPGA